MFFAGLCGALFGQNAPDAVWRKSLVFDPSATVGGPLPVNTMNLAAHQGRLYAGMAAAFERGGYSGHSASVYMKANRTAEWRLDANFGPGTERVGAMLSVRLLNGLDGKPIHGGPVEVLVAGVTKLRRTGEPSPLRIWIRNDQTGKWVASTVCKIPMTEYNVRDLIVHRDQVTGADIVILGSSPAPLGLFRAVYDPNAPGQLRWSDAPESVEDQSDLGKWFGMAEVNGVLLASNGRSIYRRIDGPPRAGSAWQSSRPPARAGTLKFGDSPRCLMSQSARSGRSARCFFAAHRESCGECAFLPLSRPNTRCKRSWTCARF